MNNCSKLLISFVFLAFTGFGYSKAQTGVTKQALYKALATDNVALWNKQLEVCQQLNGNDKAAYEGALLMRKSGSLKTPAQKLNMFKKGHKFLESAISKEPDNAEYKFLRLVIQENAPKLLGYNKDIIADTKTIKANYNSFSKELQQAVTAYSKTSKLLSGL